MGIGKIIANGNLNQIAIGKKINQDISINSTTDPSKTNESRNRARQQSEARESSLEVLPLVVRKTEEEFIDDLITFLTDLQVKRKRKQSKMAEAMNIHASTLNKFLKKKQDGGPTINRVAAYFLNKLNPLPQGIHDEVLETDFHNLYVKVNQQGNSLYEIMEYCEANGITPRAYFDLPPLDIQDNSK